MFDELEPATQERLAEILEIRGADPQQQALRHSFIADTSFPPEARVLEVGCGTGVLTRRLARWPNVGEVVAADLYPLLLSKARKLAEIFRASPSKKPTLDRSPSKTMPSTRSCSTRR